jgi:hypothetical protein
VILTLIRKHDRVLGFHGKCTWDLRPILALPEERGLPGWASALITISVLVAAILVAFLVWYGIKKHRESGERSPLIGTEEFIN